MRKCETRKQRIETVRVSIKERDRLRESPSRADVDDRLHDALAVVVNEAERTALVEYRERELVVVDETDLLDLRRAVDVVQEHLVAQNAVPVRGRHLDRVQSNLVDSLHINCIINLLNLLHYF